MLGRKIDCFENKYDKDIIKDIIMKHTKRHLFISKEEEKTILKLIEERGLDENQEEKV